MNIELKSDPESISIKSTIMAKYLTIDQVVEKKYKITEAQLKRVLYKTHYDEVEASLGF
jgi:hypothetical protein